MSKKIEPKDKYVRDPEIQLDVPAPKLHEVCEYLKTDPELEMDLPLQMTAVDYHQEGIFELVYYLYSTKKKHAIVLKLKIKREGDPQIDSVSDVWNGMDWQEREVFDLFGIKFNNHPDLRRILMWDGFPGHPLRKDYVHTTDRFDSGMEIGTPGHDAKGLKIKSS